MNNSGPKLILGALGVIIAAIIGYFGIKYQTDRPIQATQTKEAEHTASAQIGLLETGSDESDSITSELISLTPELISLTPEQFIHEYYKQVAAREYEISWSMLSDRFIEERNPTGIDDYIGFWNTIENVTVQESEEIRSNSNSADVRTILLYKKSDGTVFEAEYTFALIYNNDLNDWQIDETN